MKKVNYDICDAIKALNPNIKKLIIRRGVPVILDEGIELPPQKEIEKKMQELEHEQKITNTKVQLNNYLVEIANDVAKEYGYDNIISARSYTGYPNMYQKECVKIAEWDANNWKILETIQEKVLSGDLVINSKEDLRAQLPEFKMEEE